MTKEDGLAYGQPYGTPGEPGRLDINGVEWFACDPYPTWFRWDENDVLHTNPAKWADQPHDPEHPDWDVCPGCEKITLRAKELWEGGGVICMADGCDYWYCA